MAIKRSDASKYGEEELNILSLNSISLDALSVEKLVM